jgi:hypothetical protein
MVALAGAPAAQAAFPGRDGQLLVGGEQNVLSVVAVHGHPHRIVSLYFNGQGCEADVTSAAFSPDGKRVAYTGVWSYDSPAFCVGYTPVSARNRDRDSLRERLSPARPGPAPLGEQRRRLGQR